MKNGQPCFPLPLTTYKQEESLKNGRFKDKTILPKFVLFLQVGLDVYFLVAFTKTRERAKRI